MRSQFRLTAIEKARQLWAQKPVFLDTETTGLHDSAEIVEISVIDHQGEVLLDTLVRPRRRIPPDAVLVHGITDEMVREAPTWLHVWPQVEEALRERHVGIYNAEFDLRMMKQSHLLNGLPWRPPTRNFFCIMKLYSDFYGASRWQKLESAGRQCGLALPNSHRAREDSLLARAVFECMVNAR